MGETSRVEGTHGYDSPRGALRIVEHSPGLIESRVQGVFENGHATFFLATFDTWFARRSGPVRAFHDWSAMTDYEHDVRLRLTAWTHAHRRSFESVDILLDSKIVSLGVRFANVALGGMLRVHETRRDFDARLSEALALEIPRSRVR